METLIPIALKILKFIAFFYLMFVIALYFFQNKLLFFPDDLDFNQCPYLDASNIHSIQKIVEKQKIRYYLVSHEKPKAYFIYFHGNAGSACDRIPFAFEHKSFHVNFIFPEYPGYSNDTKKISEKIILKNAQLLLAEIQKQNIDEIPIILFGESLGTGIATYLASKMNVSALILQSAFTSLVSLGKYHYPFIPVKYLLKNKFKAYQWAPKVSCPVLSFHGQKDQIIPFKIGYEQFQNFNSSKKFVPLESAGHNDVQILYQSLLHSSIQQMIDSLSL